MIGCHPAAAGLICKHTSSGSYCACPQDGYGLGSGDTCIECKPPYTVQPDGKCTMPAYGGGGCIPDGITCFKAHTD